MKVRNFEISRQMKGIDYIYIGERTLTVHVKMHVKMQVKMHGKCSFSYIYNKEIYIL